MSISKNIWENSRYLHTNLQFSLKCWTNHFGGRILLLFTSDWVKKSWLNYSNITRQFTKNNYQTSWLLNHPPSNSHGGVGKGVWILGGWCWIWGWLLNPALFKMVCNFQPSPTLNIPQFPRWSFAAHTHRRSSCCQGSFEMFSQGLNDSITTRRRRWE